MKRTSLKQNDFPEAECWGHLQGCQKINSTHDTEIVQALITKNIENYKS